MTNTERVKELLYTFASESGVNAINAKNEILSIVSRMEKALEELLAAGKPLAELENDVILNMHNDDEWLQIKAGVIRKFAADHNIARDALKESE